MIRILIIILLAIFSVKSFSQDRVVLLTSLDAKKNIPFARSSSWNINQKLEKIFKRKLKNIKEELVVLHHVDKETLFKELSNKNNKAIFWVSHSNGSEGDIINNNTIVDYRGVDVSEVFQVPSKGLQFLGFVGCNAKFLVEKFKELETMNNNENLLTYSRAKKIDARLGLKKAIKAYLKAEKEEKLKASTQKCEDSQKIEMTITRALPREFKTNIDEALSLKVLQAGKLVGLFPKASAGDVQSIKVHLDNPTRKNDLKLVIDSGITSKNVVVGDIEVEGMNYKIFANRSGIPFGVGRHVFRYKGSLDLEIYKTNKKQINCSLEEK